MCLSLGLGVFVFTVVNTSIVLLPEAPPVRAVHIMTASSLVPTGIVLDACIATVLAPIIGSTLDCGEPSLQERVVLDLLDQHQLWRRIIRGLGPRTQRKEHHGLAGAGRSLGKDDLRVTFE